MPCPRLSALPRGGGLFGLCLVLSVAIAFGAGTTGAQVGGTGARAPGDTTGFAAESLRIADSLATAYADSIAFEEAAAEAEATFGNSRSIIDRTHSGGWFKYSSAYQVNRGNRTWTQNADFYLDPGPVQVANTTSITIGREDRIGRLNRNRSTKTEMAYRVTPFLRVGGALGLQRQTDDSRVSNFTGIKQENNDVSAQARFNQRFGLFPVRGLLSYGYLDNAQSLQSSSGATIGLNAATSRDFGNGNNVNLDYSQQMSKLNSTAEDSVGYVQTDRNTSKDLRLSGTSRINRWINADARVSSQRSRLERPTRVHTNPNDLDSPEIIVPEAVDGLTDNVDAGIHFRLPLAATFNLTGGLGRDRRVYDAEEFRTSITATQQFHADFAKPFWGMSPQMTYDNSVNDNDRTRSDPGWVESNLSRRLDFSTNRVLTRTLSARFNGNVSLTRRRYRDLHTTRFGSTLPSDQDNRKMRGSFNVSYKASQSFETGVSTGIEQSDVVNLSRSSSITNAKLRTYSVGWNWTARPGDTWSVQQNNSATAAQQYFSFTPDRDALSFIYNLSTIIGSQLSKSVRLELNHSLRLQSRGTWRLAETQRFYGKSSEFNSLDLGLKTNYTATKWLTLEAQQRLSVNPNYTVIGGKSIKTNESRRTEFTGVARISYPFGPSASFNADVRRTLATDRSRTFGTSLADKATDNDFWLASLSLRKSFGGKP